MLMDADGDKHRDGEHGEDALNADEEQVEETDGVFTKVRLTERAAPDQTYRQLYQAMWAQAMHMGWPRFQLSDQVMTSSVYRGRSDNE